MAGKVRAIFAGMLEKFTALTPELYAYLVAHNPQPDAVLVDLAAETAALGEAGAWRVAHEEAAFLTMLVRLTGARRAIEVGTFTGYGAISIARGLAPGGELLCCEVVPEFAAIAARYFTRAGLDDRITLRVAPALDSLRALPPDPVVDFAFIDADKGNYGAYYQELVPRLRPNGLIVIDNVLWKARVVDPADPHRSTKAIRALNDAIVADQRVDSVMLPVTDGLTLVRKR